MHPYRAYQQPNVMAQTRIDMLLSLYELTLKRLEQLASALERQDAAEANSLLARLQVLITGLAAGVDTQRGELGLNFLRLYDFALNSARQATPTGVKAALRVLRTLHEALVAIEPEARQLELSGQIPPADEALALRATA